MATRLRPRKPFKYLPDTTYSDSDPDHDLDETEQETLINNLESHDQDLNTLYLKIFTALPVLSISAFIIYFFTASGFKASATVRILCLLSSTSLAGTGWGVWRFAEAYSDSNGDDGKVRQKSMIRVRRVPFTDLEIDDDGPLGRSLPFLNVGICALLALSSLGLRGRDDVPEGFWMFVWVPGVMLGITVVVRRSMEDVRDGIGELKGLRYDYKGA